MAATHVFLSYCRDNAKAVAKLREDLIAAGEQVWWDQEILPGQDWRLAIRQAMKASYAVVLCLSKEAQARATSGIYPEALDAIDAYRQHAPGAVFLIPVRLNECEIPPFEISATRLLDGLQYVDLFPPSRRAEGLDRLLTALRAAPGHPVGRESVALEAESGTASGPATPTTAPEPAAPASAAERLRRYLDDLRKETGTIAIRGLQVGTGRAYAFPIDQLYISLTTAFDPHVAASLRDAIPLAERAAYGDAGLGETGLREFPGAVLLQQTLRQSRLVIVGDPGSDKTTFLRRVAFSLCRVQTVGQASSLPGKL